MAIAGLALIGQPVIAQSHNEKINSWNLIDEKLHTVFVKLDTDNNGYISIKEAVANVLLLELFHRLDKNKDNQLSKAEFMELNQEIMNLTRL